MSDEEVEYEIEMATSDPDFTPQRLRQLSDTDLDLVIKEFPLTIEPQPI
jgi:hypothetical protein